MQSQQPELTLREQIAEANKSQELIEKSVEEILAWFEKNSNLNVNSKEI